MSNASVMLKVIPYLPEQMIRAIFFLKKEGLVRNLEHLILLLVAIKVLSKLRIRSRGKLGIKHYIMKCLIRLSKKTGFVRGKMEDYLETEAVKGVSKMLESKTIKSEFGVLPQ